MSLLSRFLRIGARTAERDEPESVRRIGEQLANLGPERASFLAAFAYILARVAHVDMEVDDTEVQQMRESLLCQAELEPREAELVVEIALCQADERGGGDDYLVTREFRRLTDKPGRVRLMRALLAVAAADETITGSESTEIHSIGEELGLTRPEINGLRSEWRDNLAELNELPSESHAEKK
jgi:uncharacterized tellurite resistance protein B-like protein